MRGSTQIFLDWFGVGHVETVKQWGWVEKCQSEACRVRPKNDICYQADPCRTQVWLIADIAGSLRTHGMRGIQPRLFLEVMSCRVIPGQLKLPRSSGSFCSYTSPQVGLKKIKPEVHNSGFSTLSDPQEKWCGVPGSLVSCLPSWVSAEGNRNGINHRLILFTQNKKLSFFAFKVLKLHHCDCVFQKKGSVDNCRFSSRTRLIRMLCTWSKYLQSTRSIMCLCCLTSCHMMWFTSISTTQQPSSNTKQTSRLFLVLPLRSFVDWKGISADVTWCCLMPEAESGTNKKPWILQEESQDFLILNQGLHFDDFTELITSKSHVCTAVISSTWVVSESSLNSHYISVQFCSHQLPNWDTHVFLVLVKLRISFWYPLVIALWHPKNVGFLLRLTTLWDGTGVRTVHSDHSGHAGLAIAL